MTVFEFKEMLDRRCETFKSLKSDGARRAFALAMIECCGNNFEETCVIERLREEACI